MKNKIENQVKQQLENREIPVSENAWERLSGMMNEMPKVEKPRKINPRIWMGIAASFVVLAGLFLLFQLNSKNEIQAEIVKTEIKNSNQTQKIQVPIENEKIQVVENIKSENSNTEKIQTEIVKTETKISPKLKPEIEKTELIKTQNEIAEMKLPEKELIQNLKETENQLATNENSEKEETKKSYVDAEMLLYSIENNKTISDSKSESKLVIIDFNK